MNPEFLKNELERAEEAELESDEQLRKLTALIDKASKPNPDLCATDCAKLVSAALALNEQLRARAKSIKSVIGLAEARAEMQAKRATQ
jgi:hypothetical protein